jgi:TfoX/Sxy family transcriptional regulator of competence genes
MAYDEELATRLRKHVQGTAGVTEKSMFGGLAFLLHGNMAVSASGQGGLLVRVDPARTADLVDEPLVRRFEMRGREMDGWLRVDASAVTKDADLRRWADVGLAYAAVLPPK